jgi:hypothetical protein
MAPALFVLDFGQSTRASAEERRVNGNPLLSHCEGSQPRSNPIHAVGIASSGCGPPRNDIFMGRGVARDM